MPLTSEMGWLQTVLYLVLLVSILVGAALLMMLLGMRQLVPLFKAGHPVLASITGTAFLLIVLFLVVSAAAILQSVYSAHG